MQLCQFVRNSIIITGFSIITIISISLNKKRKRVSREKFINDFSKLHLDDKDKFFIKNARIYEINLPYPGRGFRKWKKTDSAIYYKNNTELKVYHYKIE